MSLCVGSHDATFEPTPPVSVTLTVSVFAVVGHLAVYLSHLTQNMPELSPHSNFLLYTCLLAATL